MSITDKMEYSLNIGKAIAIILIPVVLILLSFDQVEPFKQLKHYTFLSMGIALSIAYLAIFIVVIAKEKLIEIIKRR